MALSALIVVVGVGASGAAGAILRADQATAAASVLDRRAALVEQAVTAQTGRYVDTLTTIAGAVGAIDRLTADKFAHTAQPLSRMRLAGATAMAYLVPAANGQVAEVQRFWRSRGAADLVLDPYEGADEHIFTIFSQPLDGSVPAAAGIDVAQAPAPMQALVEARRSGQVAVSDTYQLIRDRNLPAAQRQMSFSLTAPVFGPPDPDGQRPFRGWVLMGLRGQDFMGTVLDQISQGMVDVSLHAGNTTGALTRVAALHSTGGPRDLHRRVEIQVAQRRWLMSIDASTSTLPSASRHPATVAIAGILLTGMLAALVFILATGRARAREQVRAATAELRASEAQLREQKADLTAFAGVVAHDLKAPLAGVAGYTEMLSDELDDGTTDPGVLRPMLHRVTAGVTAMAGLIDDLLACAATRDAAISPVDVDLRALVDEVVINHLDAAGVAGGPIPAVYVGPLPAVHADAVMVRQLLNNLIGNAIKYTAPGQIPRVDVTADMDQPPGWVHLQVADRGVGIPAGHHEAIFASFHRAYADTDIAGTGLGLAICQRIIDRHGGTISASDNPGGGTRIHLRLPAAMAAPAAAATRPADVASVAS